MQKKNRVNRHTEIASVQSYHSHENSRGASNYAQCGFTEKGYYTSDRIVKLVNGERADGKPMKGYGLEVETVSTITRQTVLAEVYDKIIFPIFPKYLWKMQNDCSLGGRSNAECITQVMTMECIRNNYSAFKAMYNDYFPAFGIKANDSSCGMHVNISRACFGSDEETQEHAMKNLLYFVNAHFDLACALTMRDRAHTRYCMPSTRLDKAFIRDNDLETLARYSCGHGCACNLAHVNEDGTARFELRVVGGQPTYGAFRNTMETIFWLVKVCKKLTLDDMDDLVKVFRGCNQYVLDRLATMCRIEHAELRQIHDAVKREDLL